MGLYKDRVQQRVVPGSSTIQFLRVGGVVVHVEVFKVLVQDRIQQRIWSRSLIFQLSEVFQIFSRARVPLLPHRVVCVTMQMRLYRGVSHFSPLGKVRSFVRTRGRNCSPSRAHPRGELMRTGMLQGDVVTSL